jgi:hypothetical protein
MSVHGKESKPMQASRRKLVRGIFAVPAIVTLTSGSPAAATSYGCLRRQAEHDPVLPTDGVGAPTNFVRIPFYKRTGFNTFFIKGSELHAIALVTGGTVASTLTPSTGWQRVANGTAENIRNNDPVLDPTPSGHLVVRFDMHGNIVGIGKGTTGSAIYGSCWLSAYPSH